MDPDLDSLPEPDALSGLDLVVTRAAVDLAFRTRLLENPRATLAEALGYELPASLRIRFIEKDANVDVMVVLPDLIGGGDQQD
jgi:hypothetical protein